MKTEKRRRALELRKTDGLSIKQIARILQVSTGSVSRWVSNVKLTAKQLKVLSDNDRFKHNYQSRMAGAAALIRASEKRIEAYKKEGSDKATRKDPQHVLGCMLYWAEGRRRNNKHTVSISSSDPRILNLFIAFLKRFFGVIPKETVTFWLKYYTDVYSSKEIEEHWMNALGLPRSCMQKPVVNYYSSYSLKKEKGQTPYGTCTIRVKKSTRILNHIYGAINKYAEIFI